MPLKQNNPHCINHPEQIMTKSEGLSAITSMQKQGTEINFSPNQGIPVRFFVCPKCKYVELYMET
ncbi:hypothetical protein N9R81_06395 [Flavobacteriales bacterium]|nr:hypothetical protein [Flavobacteriales bacterium]